MSSKSTITATTKIPFWRSISVKTGIITLLIVLVIGFAAAFAATTLFRTIMTWETKMDVWSLAKAEVQIVNSEETEKMIDDIIKTYDSIPEEKRGDGTGEEYKKAFASFIDNHYRFVQEQMRSTGEQNALLNCCIMAVDEKYNRVVYIADSDPNPETFCWPGSWDNYPAEKIHDMQYGAEPTKMEHILGLEDSIQTIWDHRSTGTIISGFAKLHEVDGYQVLICMDKRIESLLTITHKARVLFGIFLAFISIGIAVLMGLSLRRGILNPIEQLTDAAFAYSMDKKKEDRIRTRHFKDLDIHTKDEIEHLSVVMKDMEADISDYIENLREVTAERERMNTELSVAKRIQAAMLPTEFPAFPDREDFDIYATMEPAREVGGDFYDFYLIDDDHLCMVIADVSGKGIPAALMMMAARIILANKAQEGYSPAQVLEDTNERILQKNPSEMFVTVWIGILELSTGKIVASNAGHEKPVIIHPDGHAEMIQDKHGFVVGGLEGIKYNEYELQLEPGSRLFLYTDGLTEATKAGDILFGKERVMDSVGSTPGADPQQTLTKVREDVAAFVGDAEQFVDLTMLCLE